jgi:hypothetical protein
MGLEFAMLKEVETRLGVWIPPRKARRLRTVGDLFGLIRAEMRRDADPFRERVRHPWLVFGLLAIPGIGMAATGVLTDLFGSDATSTLFFAVMVALAVCIFGVFLVEFLPVAKEEDAPRMGPRDRALWNQVCHIVGPLIGIDPAHLQPETPLVRSAAVAASGEGE